MPQPQPTIQALPFSYSEARALTDRLGVSEPIAITLVRRGYRTPEAARSFLEAAESHPPEEFDSMAEVVRRILGAVRDRRRITVYGDFDVDGVCATAIAVGTLRELGAECDWLIPDRLADGYGLTTASVEELHRRGSALILTVDCGITAAAEVERAKALGMEVVVSDHHQPGAELPDCPILHPQLSGYPFTSLCGTAVAWKLSQALRHGAGRDPAEAEKDLDLVALATVADIVPLVGENRSLVRRGLKVARRCQRVGLRALVAASGCDAARLDEGDLAFRVGPRINAAGRLYRADAGVELFLGEDERRSEEIAAELDRANHERRATEREVDAAAEAARRELPDRLRDAAALVLAGSGWHPGVVGIVASRLAERHFRPTILISLDGEGGGRGSGRSIPGFDLLAGLEATSGLLERFGGHRAAAGLELRADAVSEFRERFVAHAEAALGPEQRRRVEPIDAMVGGVGLGLELAEELECLAPFGAGNPAVRLLVPGARVRDVTSMGDGKHSRFSLHSGSRRALGVAFGRSSLGVGEEETVDASVRLEVNQWNGAVEPRLVLKELFSVDGDSDREAEPVEHACACEAEEWWERLESELSVAGPGDGGDPIPEEGREVVRRGGSSTAILAELVASGEGVLALTADASRRAALVSGAASLARFGGAIGAVVCGRCARPSPEAGPSGLLVADYAILEQEPELLAAYRHVVLIDPPWSQGLEALTRRVTSDSGAYLHPVWGPAEESFTLDVLEEQLGLRAPLRAMFGELRDAEPLADERLRSVLRGSSRHPRSPELAGRCLRVLLELGIVRGQADGGVRAFGVVSSDATDLGRSPAFRAYRDRHEEAKRFLASRRQP